MATQINKYSIIFIIILNTTMYCKGQKKQSKLRTYQIEQETVLKDYFLCNCIKSGFKEVGVDLGNYDHTIQVLDEQMWTSIKKVDRLQIEKLAFKIGTSIKVSSLTQKVGVMGVCLRYYKSDTLGMTIHKIIKKNIKEVPEF